MRSLLFMFVIACSGGHKAGPPPANGSAGPPPPIAGRACAATGCSGSVCAEAGSDVITTCEMKAEYACYAKAKCERQSDGKCGWTQTTELSACLASPP